MDAVVKKPAALVEPAERKPTREEAEAAVRTLLAWTGDDPAREGLVDTPRRVVKAYEELFEGYGGDPAEILGRTFEEVGGFDDMVLVRDIPFHSHCEHHVLPFFGKVHIGYFPNGGVIGLSKFVRLVELYARRLQTQENLSAQILDAIETVLKPRGAAVMIEAEHMCMQMRGVHAHGTSTVTSQFTGLFRDDPAEQARFLAMVRAGKG